MEEMSNLWTWLRHENIDVNIKGQVLKIWMHATPIKSYGSDDVTKKNPLFKDDVELDQFILS